MKITKKLIVILISLITVICCAVGTTLAYIFTETNENKNRFDPVFVSCRVVEEFDGDVKSNVAVKNTGDVKSYIRATFIIMWTSESGSVNATMPKAGIDYEISIAGGKWVLGSDGFYYYTLPVISQEQTDVLINSITDLNTAPDGYKLTVHVAATAIQAEPTEAIEGVWGVTIGANGGLTAP